MSTLTEVSGLMGLFGFRLCVGVTVCVEVLCVHEKDSRWMIFSFFYFLFKHLGAFLLNMF